MTDQQPEDPFQRFMDHISRHACDRFHCKIAQDLALEALVMQAQALGFYDQDASVNAND